MISFDSRTLAETAKIAAALAAGASVPLRVGLDGPVGAGKTTFVRAFVTALDPSAVGWVSSPTYALIQSYPTTPATHHVDLYRLERAEDVDGSGFWEIPAGWVFVEWARQDQAVMATLDLQIRFARARGNRRRLDLTPCSVAGRAAAQAVCAKLQST